MLEAEWWQVWGGVWGQWKTSQVLGAFRLLDFTIKSHSRLASISKLKKRLFI
jgi:hypothetical protein